MDTGKLLKKIVLAAVLITAAGVRLWNLSLSPPSANWDEAALGYNAYSLWLTGKDEYGYQLPLSLRSFDDYKPPLYAYMSAPIVGIRGLDEFNIRMVSAVAGIISVGLIYLISRKLLESEWAAILAAGLTAVEPWSILFSRGAFEANLALAGSLLTVYFLILGEKRPKFLAAALMTAGVNTLVYHSAKIYLGLVVLWVIHKLRGNIFRQRFWGLLIVLAFLPLVYSFISGESQARLGSTSILKIWRQERDVFSFASNITDRYFSYFSPANIFVRGSNEPNQNISGFAPFYTWEFGIWAAGMYWLIAGYKKRQLLFWWIATASLPAILTWSWFSPVRVLPLWAGMSIVGAAGLVRITELVKQRSVRLIAGGGLAAWALINLGWLMVTIILQVPYLEYGKWQWGFRETMQTVSPLLSRYERVVWETPQAQPHIFVLFYGKYPPAQYHRDLGSPQAVPIPRKNFDFGKFTFRKIYWPKDKDEKGTLFIGSVYSLPEKDLERDGVKIIQEITDPQGYVIYRIAGT